MQKLSFSSGRRLLKKWWLDFRRSLAHAPVLSGLYPSFIQWEWDYQDPAFWNVYQSADGGHTWFLEESGWTGENRDYAPSDGTVPTFIVGVNENGVEVTRRSRIIVPSDTPYISPFWSGLVGYFNLDEAGDWDDAVDSAGSMGDLVANGSIPHQMSGPGPHGARDFGVGGIYSGSQLEQAGFNALTSVPVTFNIWHYHAYYGGEIPFQAFGDGSFGFYLFVATDAGWLDAGVVGAIGNQNTGQVFGGWGFDVWNMFTIVFGETDWRVYVNGVEIGTGTHAATSFAASNILFQLSGTPWTCDAYLALMGLWNRALSAGEVDALYNFGNGLSYGEL